MRTHDPFKQLPPHRLPKKFRHSKATIFHARIRGEGERRGSRRPGELYHSLWRAVFAEKSAP